MAKLPFSSVLTLTLALAACETVAPPGDRATMTAAPAASTPSASPPDAEAAAPETSAEAAARAPRGLPEPTPEQRALRVQILRQLQPCLQDAARDMSEAGDTGQIAVYFGFAPDGTLAGARLPDASMSRYESDAAYRTAVDTMVESVAACSPLAGMPEDQHQDWGVFPLVFQPQEA
mgnify:FL=1